MWRTLAAKIPPKYLALKIFHDYLSPNEPEKTELNLIKLKLNSQGMKPCADVVAWQRGKALEFSALKVRYVRIYLENHRYLKKFDKFLPWID